MKFKNATVSSSKEQDHLRKASSSIVGGYSGPITLTRAGVANRG